MDFGPFNKFYFNEDDKEEVVNVETIISKETEKRFEVMPELFNPTNYSEAETIADTMIEGKSVIVNLELMLNNESKKADGIRVVDYLCGVAHALKMDVVKINGSTFYFSLA